MRKLGCLLGMVLLLCLTAAAQDAPKAEAFLGYSYVREPGHIRGKRFQPERRQRVLRVQPNQQTRDCG
jgi:hypothetical protein